MNYRDDVQKAIGLLVFTNMSHRDHMSGLKGSMSPVQYLKEMCTVSCDPGRQTGKSYYILQNADKNSLIIVCSSRELDRYKDSSANVILASDVYKVNRMDRYKVNHMDRYPHEKIYVDNASHLFKMYDKNRIYESVSYPEIEQTFILLG